MHEEFWLLNTLEKQADAAGQVQGYSKQLSAIDQKQGSKKHRLSTAGSVDIATERKLEQVSRPWRCSGSGKYFAQKNVGVGAVPG